MNAPAEKDYIDSKLQASDAHLEKIELELQSTRHELALRITQAESNFQRSLDCTRDELTNNIRQAEKNLEHRLQSIRDEFNAKLVLMEANFQYSLQLAKEEINTRFSQMEAKFQRDLQAVRVELNEKISQLEGRLHRSLIDAVKWMVGTMIALTAISITVSSTLFLRLASKVETSAKAPASAVSSPQSARTAHGEKTLSASLTLAAQSPQPVATHPATAPTRTTH